MTVANVIERRREPAHRVGSGLEVTLYWTANDYHTLAHVRYATES